MKSPFKTDPTNQSTRWISRDFAALLAEIADRRSQPKHLGTADYDVLILGSGYGGAMAAASLSGCADKYGRNIRVALVERGLEYLPGSFPSRMEDVPGRLRGRIGTRRFDGEGLFDLRVGADVSVVAANGLGGGSLINAGVMEKPKPGVFTRSWPSNIAANPHALDQDYERALKLLGAGTPSVPNTIRLHHEHSGVGPVKQQVLQSLGQGSFRDAAITVAMSDGAATSAGVKLNACLRCGDCASGCNYGAKESLDTNLLFQAHRRGANIFCGGTALLVRKHAAFGSPSGPRWEAQLVHTDRKLRAREGEPTWVSAHHLIIAAGSLGSTELLLRSQRTSPNLRFSPQLGKRFSSNGDMLSFGYNFNRNVNAIADQDIAPGNRNIGPTITGVVDITVQGKPAVLEEMAVPGPLRRITEELLTTASLAHDLANVELAEHKYGHPADDPLAVSPKRIAQTALFALMGDDGAEGSIVLDADSLSDQTDGSVSVVWPQAKHQSMFDEQNALLAERAEAAELGGRVLPNPLWRPLPEAMSRYLGASRGALLTVHPLGGCSMGQSVNEGVVDENGRVFDLDRGSSFHAGLYVLDGSIIPSALSTNPALTIAVLAMRAAEALRASLDWTQFDSGWSHGHRTTPRRFIGTSKPVDPAKPGDATLNDVVADVEARIVAPRDHAVAEFTERLSGPVWLLDRKGQPHQCRVEMTLTYEAVQLRQLFLAGAAGSLAKACLRLGNPNGEAELNPGTADANRMLRIFREADWRRLQLKALSAETRELELERAALCVFELTADSSLTILRRERSTLRKRVWGAFLAWLGNRGIRDLLGTGHGMLRYVRLGRNWQAKRRQVRAAKVIGLAVHYDRPSIADRLGSLRAKVQELKAMLSHAGEVRLFEYVLFLGSIRKKRVDDTAAPVLPEFDFEACTEPTLRRIKGCKRITYSYHGNPWRQLMEMELKEFPLPIVSGQRAVLSLDTGFLIQRNTPLLRLMRQTEHMSALVDVASLGLLFLRTLASIHLLSLRKPPRPRSRRIKRLPGPLPGIEAPDIHNIVVDEIDGRSVSIRLTRYRKRPDVRGVPVLMIHGYSASGTTFAHPALRPSLAQVMVADDRDVWVLDLRTSPDLPESRHPWTMERVATSDIPAAIDYVWAQSGRQRVDVVAHCMGAAMFSMAVLSAGLPIEAVLGARDADHRDRFPAERRALPSRIRRAVLSQVGPVMVLSPQNQFRAFVQSFVNEIFGPLSYRFRPSEDEGVGWELFDRFLATLPYPDADIVLEQHASPFRNDEYLGTRHRMDALYGRTFTLGNISSEVLENLDDFFGAISLDTVGQVGHFARQQSIATRGGRNRFLTPTAMRKHWTFDTLALHGVDNGLVDLSTINRQRRLFKTVTGQDINRKALRGRGHQDCLIGTESGDACREIRDFLQQPLSGKPRRLAAQETLHRREIVAGAPWLGPLITPLATDPSCSSLLLSAGADPAVGTPLAITWMPVRPAHRNGRTVWRIDDATIKQIRRAHPSASFFEPVASTTDFAQRVEEPHKDWLTWTVPLWMAERRAAHVAVLLVYRQADVLNAIPAEFPTDTHNARHVEPEGSGTGHETSTGRLPPTRDRRHSLTPFNGKIRTFVGGIFRRLNLAVPLPPDMLEESDYGEMRPITQWNKKIQHDEPSRRIRTVVHEALKRLPSTRLNDDQSTLPLGIVNLPKFGNNALTIALASCQYPRGILDQVPATQSWNRLNRRFYEDNTACPQMLVLCGDQVYTDATAGLFDPYLLDDRFRNPYINWLKEARFRSALRRLVTVTLPDDHEIDDNWEPLAPQRSGKSHDPNGVLWREALTGFLRFQRPLPSGARIAGSPRHTAARERFGGIDMTVAPGGIPIFLLDTRTRRRNRAAARLEQAHMIRSQWTRLTQWLKHLDDRPKVIVTPACFLPRHRDAARALLANGQKDQGEHSALRSDSWDGYPLEFTRLLAFIAEEQIQRVVFLSGDEHLGLFCEASVASTGKKAVKVYSVHTPGIYTPYGFANAKPSDFILSENIGFEADALTGNGRKRYCCDVSAETISGSGYALIQILREKDQGWKLRVDFDVESSTKTWDPRREYFWN